MSFAIIITTEKLQINAQVSIQFFYVHVFDSFLYFLEHIYLALPVSNTVLK